MCLWEYPHIAPGIPFVLPSENGEKAAYIRTISKFPRLTINLGLRYEYSAPARDRDNTPPQLQSQTHAIVMGTTLDKLVALEHAHPATESVRRLGREVATPQQAYLPDGDVSNRLIGPRIGALSCIGNQHRPTVLRGGYAIFAYPEQLGAITCEARAIVPDSCLQ
jgi:hypothetical protein